MHSDKCPDRPHFTKAGQATYPAGAPNTAVGPRAALGLLENAIGGTAREGLIHADPATFLSWAAWDLVETDGKRAYTVRGTTVIIGDGYIGVTPGAALTAGVAYAWATGRCD